MPTSLKLASVAVLFAVLPASMVHAQCTPGGPANPPAIKRAIVGVVMDSAHNVLQGVDVIIRDPRRNVKTDARGRFQILDLEPGTNELTVRRFGYEIAVQTIAVTDTGGVARFCLLSEARGLPAMITSAARGGLSGVIGDSTYAVLPGAEVRVVGEGGVALSDSAGGFYLPLKKGTYAIQVSKKGFGQQLLSVTVPADSGRQIAVWLGSKQRNANRLAMNLDAMKWRIVNARPNRFALLSSEELSRTSLDLTQSVRMAAKASVSDDCEATIDGGPWTLPLYMIDKNNIAMLEVHVNAPPRSTVTSLNPEGTASRPSAGGGGKAYGVKVYAWLKP